MNSHLKQVLTKGNPPKWLETNLHYVTIMGSMAYNCHHPHGEKSVKLSDMDLYGFAMPPKHIVFPHIAGYLHNFGKSPENFEQWQEHHIHGDIGYEYDVTIFSIIKYAQLCMDGNPNMIDSLFTPDNCVLHKTAVGAMMRDNRKLFLSKQVKVKMCAYAYQQLRKLEANSHAGSEARKIDIATNGYDTKKAYHTVRLVLQAEQVLTEGDLDLTANAEILKDIRAGNWKLQELQDYFTNKEKLLDAAYHTSNLQQRPDEQAVKQLLLNCIEHHYGSLSNAEIVVPDKHMVLLNDLRGLLHKHGG